MPLVLIEGLPDTGKSGAFERVTKDDKIFWMDIETKPPAKFIKKNTVRYKPKSADDMKTKLIAALKSDKVDVIVVDAISRYSTLLELKFKEEGVVNFAKWDAYRYEFDELARLANSTSKIVIFINHLMVSKETGELVSVAKGEFKDTGGWLSHVDIAMTAKKIDGERWLILTDGEARVPFDMEFSHPKMRIDGRDETSKKQKDEFNMKHIIAELKEYFNDEE